MYFIREINISLTDFLLAILRFIDILFIDTASQGRPDRKPNKSNMTRQADITLQWLLGRGWTPIEAAEKLGVTSTHLRKVLNGKADRGGALLKRVAKLPYKSLTSLRRSK